MEFYPPNNHHYSDYYRVKILCKYCLRGECNKRDSNSGKYYHIPDNVLIEQRIQNLIRGINHNNNKNTGNIQFNSDSED